MACSCTIEQFDVTRGQADNREHMGLDSDLNICEGMHLARLEITLLIKAFARRVNRFEVGETTRAVNEKGGL
jgi:hypothetical protein